MMDSFAFVRSLAADPLPSPAVSSATTLRERLVTLPGATNTVERAALAGLAANGVGWAFAGGYQSALAHLDPRAVEHGQLAALCVTEEGGGHPRAMRTTLSPDGKVTGRKTFVTLGSDADVLLVVANTGQDDAGRNRLRVVRVPAKRAGVTVSPLDPLPFAPEIGHAAATLDQVAIGDDELFEGDGYELVVKPFRTIEDIHVMAAILGWSISVARCSNWGRSWIEEAAALISGLRTTGGAPPLAPETHIVLSGLLPSVKRLLDGAPWSSTDAGIREGWERDRPLLDIASRVREARRETAWAALSNPPT